MPIGFNEAWYSDFTSASGLSMSLGAPSPTGTARHHLSTQDLLTSTSNPLDPDVQRLVIELGNFVDPATGRAVFDLGSRADNMIVLPTSDVPGQITHAGSHPGARDFAREVAEQAAK